MRNFCLYFLIISILVTIIVNIIFWGQNPKLFQFPRSFYNSSFYTKQRSLNNHFSSFFSEEKTVTIRSSLIVPVQNRNEQVNHFISFFCNKSKDSDNISVHFIEQQNSDKSFNRAKLFNIGLELVMNSSICVVIHDVDLLPHEDVDYLKCDMPIHLGSQPEHHNWGVPYPSFSGGVFSASPKHWRQINGVSNLFHGWGGEDDEMFLRFRHHNLTDTLATAPYRPPHGKGIFFKNSLNHFRKDLDANDYNMNVQILKRREMFPDEFAHDGLSSLQYVTLNSTVIGNCSTHFTRTLVVI